MKIAVFLKDDNHIDESIVQVYAFTVEDEVITNIASELLSILNIKYLVSWLLNKSIETVYMNNDDENVKLYFNKIGIKTKSLYEIKDNPLLKIFLIKKQ